MAKICTCLSDAQQRIQGKEYRTFETKNVKNLMCNILRNFTYSEPFTAHSIGLD